jgi:hypothetical protein
MTTDTLLVLLFRFVASCTAAGVPSFVESGFKGDRRALFYIFVGSTQWMAGDTRFQACKVTHAAGIVIFFVGLVAERDPHHCGGAILFVAGFDQDIIRLSPL